MALRAVDHTSISPPYEQIEAELIRQIESGELAVGARIATESEIVQACGVARDTARRAVRALRDKGYVQTRPQRGSYVLDRSGTKEG